MGRKGRRAGAGLLVLSLLLSGCGSGAPVPEPATSSSEPAWSRPRAALTSVVALSKDRRYTATYLWKHGSAERTVTVLMAEDGTWRVDVPGGALGGRADVSILWTAQGFFQCVLAGGPQQCVRMAAATGAVPRGSDPQVQHLFTDWLDVLLDRNAPLSIAAGKQPKGASGECFSVESNSVVLSAPIATGTYCFAPDGVPTAVKVWFGTVTLVGEPLPAAPTATLPADVSEGAPLGTKAPPPPPKPSESGSPKPRD
ncbi:hypothetical protein AB0I28_04735 [Phytomonospora sp. NPDC050363]|uniref:hypothetical protein n=1 Tax=Phytomonospora sp. NPDC050363 TaxID=3155642 RepID=UPI0033F2378D